MGRLLQCWRGLSSVTRYSRPEKHVIKMSDKMAMLAAAPIIIRRRRRRRSDAGRGRQAVVSGVAVSFLRRTHDHFAELSSLCRLLPFISDD